MLTFPLFLSERVFQVVGLLITVRLLPAWLYASTSPTITSLLHSLSAWNYFCILRCNFWWALWLWISIFFPLSLPPFSSPAIIYHTDVLITSSHSFKWTAFLQLSFIWPHLKFLALLPIFQNNACLHAAGHAFIWAETLTSRGLPCWERQAKLPSHKPSIPCQRDEDM